MYANQRAIQPAEPFFKKNWPKFQRFVYLFKISAAASRSCKQGPRQQRRWPHPAQVPLQRPNRRLGCQRRQARRPPTTGPLTPGFSRMPEQLSAPISPKGRSSGWAPGSRMCMGRCCRTGRSLSPRRSSQWGCNRTTIDSNIDSMEVKLCAQLKPRDVS